MSDCVMREDVLWLLYSGKIMTGDMSGGKSAMKWIKELPPAEEKATVWNQVKEPPKKAGEYLVTGKWRDEPRKYWICTFSIFGPICGWENSASNPPVEAWAQITPFEEYQNKKAEGAG